MWILTENVYLKNDDGSCGKMVFAKPVRVSKVKDMLYMFMCAYVTELEHEGFVAESFERHESVLLKSDTSIRVLIIDQVESIPTR